MYLISIPSESYDQTSMTDTTLKHPRASDLTSTGSELLIMYRVQKRNPSKEPFRCGHGGQWIRDVSTESSLKTVRWTEQGSCLLPKHRALTALVLQGNRVCWELVTTPWCSVFLSCSKCEGFFLKEFLPSLFQQYACSFVSVLCMLLDPGEPHPDLN